MIEPSRFSMNNAAATSDVIREEAPGRVVADDETDID
jgi:hypothetical protein